VSNSNIQYAIAAGHAITAQVAEEVLLAGGNAFDAGVAAYLVSFISEPVMASVGAGGFANIVTRAGEQFILDFFCQTPKSQDIVRPNYEEIVIDFGESQETFYAGPASMAVPGAIALINHLINKHCSMHLKELVQPAQKLATEGILYTPFQAEDTLLLANILTHSDHGKKLFIKDGKLITDGDRFRLPSYADFLESFAREKGDWFYRGEIAQTVSEYSKDNGGFLRYNDFEDYRITKTNPFNFSLGDRRISVPSLPSMGGGLMNLFLEQFEKSSKQSQTIQKLSNLHYRALRASFENANKYAKDANHLAQKIREKDAHYSIPENTKTIIPNGTSHFNILDKYGNGISLSTSIGEGSSYFIPGTDMHMNNMLGETALMPNGLNSWSPNTRLNSMMCPTLVFDQKNQLVLLTGSGGSTRIPFSLAQLLINRYQLKMNLNDSIHAPRIFESDEQIYAEKGYEIQPSLDDKRLIEWEGLELLFGGTHTIDLESNEAIGDKRREGCGIIKFND